MNMDKSEQCDHEDKEQRMSPYTQQPTPLTEWQRNMQQAGTRFCYKCRRYILPGKD